jgi:hypothetical protein
VKVKNVYNNLQLTMIVKVVVILPNTASIEKFSPEGNGEKMLITHQVFTGFDFNVYWWKIFICLGSSHSS